MAENLRVFAKSYLNGKLKPYLSSQEAADQEGAEPSDEGKEDAGMSNETNEGEEDDFAHAEL